MTKMRRAIDHSRCSVIGFVENIPVIFQKRLPVCQDHAVADMALQVHSSSRKLWPQWIKQLPFPVKATGSQRNLSTNKNHWTLFIHCTNGQMIEWSYQQHEMKHSYYLVYWEENTKPVALTSHCPSPDNTCSSLPLVCGLCTSPTIFKQKSLNRFPSK